MKIISKLYTSLIFIFLYAPIAVMIVFSFNESKSRSTFTGMSLKWYTKLFQDSEILKAFANSIIIAIVASLLATIIGTAASVGITKMKRWLQKFIMNMTNLPMINPEIVTGVSLMILFVLFYEFLGIFQPGMFTLVLAHTTFCLPYIILSVLPRLRQMNQHLYEQD